MAANELMVSASSLELWHDEKMLAQIKAQVSDAPLSDVEFMTLMQIGKTLQLNPFLRELWAVKYSVNAKAQIFIGRDGYRKVAQRHPAYDYHQCDAVYENDSFMMNKGEIQHSYTLKDRGKLIGAYCIVQRKNASRPINVFVELKEYSTGKSLWHPETGKPATMIKKVAEAQALRAAFQELFAGTYIEEEMEKGARVNQGKVVALNDISQTERLKQALNINEETGEIIEESSPKVHNTGRDDVLISDEQLDEICSLFKEKEFTDERIDKVLQYYKVESLEKLTDAQARLLLLQLEKA